MARGLVAFGIATTLSLGFAALSVALAPVAKAVDYGGFFEHTLYTQDGESAEDYKDDVIVLFHGFRSAMPNNHYQIFYNTFGLTHTVAGYNYDYTDVERNMAELDDLMERYLKGRRLTVVGTSLGGFWANYFANKVGAERLILINPVVDPMDTMRRNMGQQFSKKRQQNFIVTEDHVEAYAQVSPGRHNDTSTLVLLARDDEVLDYTIAEKTFIAHGEVVVFDQGGHRLPIQEADIMAIIKGFIEAGEQTD